MILLIDDDPVLLTLLKRMLESDGQEVISFSVGREAIDYLRTAPSPELIVSDIVMPEMDGFAFQTEVKKLPAHRRVPFIFLSSLSDEETMVRGLDRGADDYLLKPVVAPVFKAKVRAILRKQRQQPTPTFHGTLEKLPFLKIFQFCESKGLTGTVEIESEEATATLEFKGGELNYEALSEADEILDKLYGLKAGTFRIAQYLTSFEEIQDARIAGQARVPDQLESKPMGMLSGVKVNEKLVQVQTEYVTTPSPAVVTIVVYDGRTIHKKVDDSVTYLTRDAIEALIKEQHHGVESHIREKLSAPSPTKEEQPAPPSDFTRLFDAGLDHYMAGHYEEALTHWTKAYELDPDHKLLNINLGVVRKKLEQ